MKLYIKIKSVNGGKIPEYQTPGSAGADCYARVEQPVIIRKGERALIPLGFAVEVPEGYEMQIRPRSGLAHRNGITILNTPGTIDSDYRGEVHANIFNTSDEDFIINKDDRIAQAVISPVYRAEYILSVNLSETERGTGGHGSTGK